MAEVAANAGASTPVHPAFHGMRRWGYVRYSPDIKGTPKVRDGEAIVHLTPAGDSCTANLATGHDRCRGAAGRTEGSITLRDALVPVAASIERPLPEYFPVLDSDFGAPAVANPLSRPARRARAPRTVVPGLARDDVRLRSGVATVPRDVRQRAAAARIRAGARCGTCPTSAEPRSVCGARRSGDSRSSACCVSETAPSGRGKSVRLTDDWLQAQRAGAELLAEVDERWRDQGGADLGRLANELAAIVGDGRPGAPVFEGITPYPECWRAKLEPDRRTTPSTTRDAPRRLPGRQLTHCSTILAMSSIRTRTVGSTRSMRILGGLQTEVADVERRLTFEPDRQIVDRSDPHDAFAWPRNAPQHHVSRESDSARLLPAPSPVSTPSIVG